MKYLMSMLVLLSTFVEADTGNSINLTSFSELGVLSEDINNRQISLRGFLLKDEGEFYFCSSMESCYSRGKERIVVKSNDEVQRYLLQVSECHMELTGVFQSLNKSQKGWPIAGYFKVDEKPTFDFNPSYHLINKNCRAYNAMKE